MSLHATILTLFPEMFPGPLGHSLIGRALEDGKWSLDCINIRDFGLGKHRQVDDTPAGGGAGLVMRADVLGSAIEAAFAKTPGAQLIYMSPRGKPLTQVLASELTAPHPNPLPKEREYDSVPTATTNARQLRRNQTDVEQLLWSKLRNKQLNNTKFRRQHPIDRYIVDFLCEEKKLIIELDGGQHTEENDKQRTETLESLGFTVLRFWNNELNENLEGVLLTIANTLEKLPLPGERVGVRGKTELIILCGRFEGVDERIIEKYQPLEVSLGDFVMTGGEIAAMALLDTCVRMQPDVLGEKASLEQESFGLCEDYACLLEHPHYSKPPSWEGLTIPEVLTSGHHERIERWRKEKAEEITKARRPDLWAKHINKGTES